MDDETKQSTWAAAEETAARNRLARLHPSGRRFDADRLLRPIVITIWVVTTVVDIVALVSRSDLHDLLLLVGEAGELVLLITGMWWLLSSGRYILRGGATSIRSALPDGAWPDVRRQLTNRLQPDPDHVDVILELAHQQRRLLAGQGLFLAFYLPLYLALAANSHGWIGPAFLTFATVLGIVAVVFLIVAQRRLTRVVHLIDVPTST